MQQFFQDLQNRLFLLQIRLTTLQKLRVVIPKAGKVPAVSVIVNCNLISLIQDNVAGLCGNLGVVAWKLCSKRANFFKAAVIVHINCKRTFFQKFVKSSGRRIVHQCSSKLVVATVACNLRLTTLQKLRVVIPYQESAEATKQPYHIADDIIPELAKIFDFCVIDTSPALGAIERSCFAASDEVVPVLQLNQFSVDGLTIFTNNLGQIKKDMRLGDKPTLSKIVLNGYDARIAQQNDNLAKFKSMNMSGVQFFTLPTDQAFSKSQKIKVAPQDQAATNTKKETLDVLKTMVDDPPKIAGRYTCTLL